MDELKCPICGEPTYLVYGKNPRKDRLCKTHGTMANKGLIEQCPDCGKWHKANETCDCKQTKKPEPKTVFIECDIRDLRKINDYLPFLCFQAIKGHNSPHIVKRHILVLLIGKCYIIRRSVRACNHRCSAFVAHKPNISLSRLVQIRVINAHIIVAMRTNLVQ